MTNDQLAPELPHGRRYFRQQVPVVFMAHAHLHVIANSQ
jgi:hypothetical protein